MSEPQQITLPLSEELAVALATLAARRNMAPEQTAIILLTGAIWEEDHQVLGGAVPVIVRLANSILANAIDSGAEAVFLVPRGGNLEVELLVNGVRLPMTGPTLLPHLIRPLIQTYERMADIRLQPGPVQEGCIPIVHGGINYDIFIRYEPDLASTRGHSFALRPRRKEL